MASKVAVVGSTFTFGVSLVSQADTDTFQANPTIAAGDFQRSINGAAFANLDNLPTVAPAAGKRVQIVLSAAETTSAAEGGEIYVVASDAADDEWQDQAWSIRVYAADIASQGDNMGLSDDAITSAKYDESTAYPLKSADSGSTQVARTGADGDTLETLSDEIAVVDGNVDSVLADTGTDGVVLANDAITSAKFDESTAFPQTSADVGAIVLP